MARAGEVSSNYFEVVDVVLRLPVSSAVLCCHGTDVFNHEYDVISCRLQVLTLLLASSIISSHHRTVPE
jgi:hypothetical protein